jgi:excisionase family DNA binding protein
MKSHAAKDQLVGPEVVAARLNISRNTVLNWARDGKIPCFRVGKIYRFSLKKISTFVGYPLEDS